MFLKLFKILKLFGDINVKNTVERLNIVIKDMFMLQTEDIIVFYFKIR